MIALRRLTFELAASQPQLAEVRYRLAECYFQTGDRVQAAHEFRQVADQFATSEYAPLALLRAGDANLRLWRKPELEIGRASCRERSVDLGGRRIIKKKKVERC